FSTARRLRQMRCTMRFFSGGARLRLSWWQSTRAAVNSGASLRLAAGLRFRTGSPAKRSPDSTGVEPACAARASNRLSVGVSGLTRAPPQIIFHELAELIDELDVALVDRLECDLLERIEAIDRLRGFALRGEPQAKLRDEFFQTVLSHVGLPAVGITSELLVCEKNAVGMFRLYERAD